MWKMGLLRRVTGSFRNREAARVVGRWRDAHAEALLRKHRLQVMEAALRRVKQRELTRACLAWSAFTAYLHEGQRLLRLAARASAKMKQPRLVAAMDSWKAQAKLWDAFDHERQKEEEGTSSSLARCTAQCLPEYLGKILNGARKAVPVPLGDLQSPRSTSGVKRVSEGRGGGEA